MNLTDEEDIRQSRDNILWFLLKLAIGFGISAIVAVFIILYICI